MVQCACVVARLRCSSSGSSAAPVAIDYYSIASPGSALDAAGWTSFDDQNFDVGLPADLDRDGVVDADDLTAWRGAFGPSLVGDANGEVVVFNDSGYRALAIRTEAAVAAEGRAQKHVTAAGEDVSGFNYITFDNGVTLYYPAGLDLILDRG